MGDEFEFTVVQDQSSTFSNTRQSAIRMKLLSPGTVQFETRIENNLSGVICKEVPMNNWSSRSPTKNQNGHNGDAPESGLITYQVNGVKKTVPFYSKDCDMKHYPRLGDKVSASL